MYHQRPSALLCAVALTLTLCSQAVADEIRVPRDQPTLADALAVAQDGDVVKLKRGEHAGGTFDVAQIALVGRGATVTGGLSLTGEGVAVVGVRFRDGGLDITGVHARISECRFKAAPLRVVGDDCIVRDCSVRSPGTVGIDIEGDGAVVSTTRASKLDGPPMIRIRGDDFDVGRCRISDVFVPVDYEGGDPDEPVAIHTTGDGGIVSKNRIRRCSVGISARGEDVSIVENVVSVRRRPGPRPRSPWGSVAIHLTTTADAGEKRSNQIGGNRVRLDSGAGVRVFGTGGVSVVSNSISSRGDPTTAIEVQSDDNVVIENRSYGRSKRVMSLVRGDRNIVRDNRLRNLVVTGEDNEVDANAER